MSPRDTKIIGQTFGFLTVLYHIDVHCKNSRYQCRCVCGNERIASRPNLLRGKHKIISCGCKTKEMNSQKRRVHGHTSPSLYGSKKSPIYNVWRTMNQREVYT